ncbi:MAG: hypothetical protein ACXWC4_04265 [Telluria sp.]
MMNATIQTDLPAGAAPATTKAYRASTVVSAAGAALQWRLVLLWTIVLLVPTAVSALPVWQLLSASFDHSVHAPALATSLGLDTISDLVATNARNGTGIGNGNLLALLFTLLLSPLLAGMTIHAARAPAAPRVGALIVGGVQEYARLLRMLAWAIVPLGIVAAIAAGAFAAAKKYAEASVLESSADHALLGATIAVALLFAIADASLDAGRAVLAGDRRRRSAVKAWWTGFRILLRRPIATLGTYLVITIVGLAIAALLAVARLNVAPLGLGGWIGAFLLTQLAVLTLGWMRSARLFAMLELVRAPSR